MVTSITDNGRNLNKEEQQYYKKLSVLSTYIQLITDSESKK